MAILTFLISFPLIIAMLLLIIPNIFTRRLIVYFASALLGGATLLLLVTYFSSNIKLFAVESEYINLLMMGIELALMVFIVVISLKRRKHWAAFLSGLQTTLLIWFELKYGAGLVCAHQLFVDKFSLIMALIVGIVGSLIAVYAVGYMEDFKHHYPEIKDRSNLFFFIIFVFLSAMFGIIFANSLPWLYFFWEITTICSFILIGYKGDKESKKNAFRALTINLLGGLVFALGLIYLGLTTGIIELDGMLACGKTIVILPAVCFAFSGMTKSAQLPFSSWLLGAMVAPTPVSALLHSSTMVKAGVYLIIKIAPILHGTFAGFLIALIGGFTFLITSALAVAQRDAKKVLAYSTIANLGLIVACGGVGNYEAIWAAVLLIIFHALAKALLFLCVGTAEHQLNSRSIEDMEGTIFNMPKIAWMLLVGMAGMFLAPFGMLISKWAVLRAFVDSNIFLAVLVIYGSAISLFFWVKWMGKILMVIKENDPLEKDLKKDELFALYSLTFLTISICAFFPVVSYYMIEPYVISIYGYTMTMSKGNLTIMLIMMAMLVIFRFSLPRSEDTGKSKIVNPYLGGANTGDGKSFRSSLGVTTAVTLENFYLERYCGEKTLYFPSLVIATALILIMFGVVVL